MHRDHHLLPSTILPPPPHRLYLSTCFFLYYSLVSYLCTFILLCCRLKLRVFYLDLKRSILNQTSVGNFKKKIRKIFVYALLPFVFIVFIVLETWSFVHFFKLRLFGIIKYISKISSRFH